MMNLQLRSTGKETREEIQHVIMMKFAINLDKTKKFRMFSLFLDFYPFLKKKTNNSTYCLVIFTIDEKLLSIKIEGKKTNRREKIFVFTYKKSRIN